MKKLVLSVLAAVGLFATQASAQSVYSYGSPYYGSNYTYGSNYYGTAYRAPAGPYVHIGHLNTTPNYYGTTYSTGYTPIAASYRTSAYTGYNSGYNVLPATYTSGTYTLPSTSYTYPSSSYTYPSYGYGYGYNSYPSYSYGSSTLGSSYIVPSSSRVVSTVPYTGYSSSYYNGCNC